MNGQILHYVQQIEATVLNELAITNTSNLYQIASYLIEQNKEDFQHICQAYEIVKRNLAG